MSGAAGAGVLAAAVGGGLISRHAGAGEGSRPAALREVRLEARELSWELAPGKVVKAMAYNGQIPGPEIRLKEGERVRIVLQNRLPEPTTVHWHGVDVPNPMDGVPGITQKPVPPDEAFSYEFEARPAGTRWYHTHFQEHRQLDLGLAGPLIIEPAGAEPFAFDREYTLVLDDWATGSGPALRSTAEGTAGASGGMTGMMGRRMMHREMMSHSHGPAYDTMTINGKAYPATQPLTVRRGERVRLRIINASADHTHVIRLAGHRLRVTHTDGSPLVQAVEVDAIPVAPAERYDAFFVADRPGAWFLTCAAPGHARAGEQVLVVYEGHEKSAAGPVAEGIAGLSLWRYDLGHGMDILPRPWGQERVFDLALSGGMMGSDFWTINGKRYPETDPLVLGRGDLGRIRFSNMSPEGHPMHLHGQSFRVLAVNGRRLGHPLVKDTVDVAPHMGSATIEFTAHNPGDWFLHCHKPMHMEGGLIALARILPS